MTTILHTRTLQRTTHTLLIALLSVALFAGCTGDLPVAPEAPEASTLAAAKAAAASANSNGLTFLRFPSEFPGPPLYASGTGKLQEAQGFGALRTDGEWVAIAFERQPDCVPEDYNLLSAPNIPVVFDCTLTVEGHGLVRETGGMLIPVKAWHNGLGAVPIYFAELSEYEAAVMDDELTIGDFNSLSSLEIGYASFHREVIQFPQSGRPGMHNIVSRGELEDGRSFQLKGSLVGTEWNATITFE